MTRSNLLIAVALLAALAAAPAGAQPADTAERRWTLPDHGAFVAQVPRAWLDRLRPAPERLPPTIELRPASGPPFTVLLTPIWPAPPDRPPASGEALRAQVERAARRAQAQAVEPEVRVMEFQGRADVGFRFSATDRAPKPGEYRFLTQGVLRVGDLAVSFTILTDDGQDQVVAQALELLRSATHDTTR